MKMNWKYLLAIVGIAGVGALTLAQPKGLEKQRNKVRKAFKVTGDCRIEYRNDPEMAQAFWESNRDYLTEMIRLAQTIGVTDVPGVAAYTMLNLFPECDPTQEHTLSYTVMVTALEVRIRAIMMEQGQ